MGSSESTEFFITNKNLQSEKHKLNPVKNIYEKLYGLKFTDGKKYMKNITIEEWLELYIYTIDKWQIYNNLSSENFKQLIIKGQKTMYSLGDPDGKAAYTYICSLTTYLNVIKLIILDYFRKINYQYSLNKYNLNLHQMQKFIERHNKSIDTLNVDMLQSNSSNNNSNIIYLESSLSYVSFYSEQLTSILYTYPKN